MNEIFEKILAIDERAKKIAAGEEQANRDADAELAEKLAKLKNDFDDKYSADLNSEIEKDRADAQKRIAGLEKAVEEQKKALDKTAQDNREKWIDGIMKELIG